MRAICAGSALWKSPSSWLISQFLHNFSRWILNTSRNSWTHSASLADFRIFWWWHFRMGQHSHSQPSFWCFFWSPMGKQVVPYWDIKTPRGIKALCCGQCPGDTRPGQQAVESKQIGCWGCVGLSSLICFGMSCGFQTDWVVLLGGVRSLTSYIHHLISVTLSNRNLPKPWPAMTSHAACIPTTMWILPIIAIIAIIATQTQDCARLWLFLWV